MSEARKIWELQPGETPKAWAAWEVYRDLPDETRSVRELARTLGKFPQTFNGWSVKWHWPERIHELRLEQNRKIREAELAAMCKEAAKFAVRRAGLREEQFDLSTKLMAKVEAMLAFPLTKQVVSKDGKEIHIHPVKWTLETMCSAARSAMHLRALALGDVTDRISTTTEPTPLVANQATEISDEQVMKILNSFYEGKNGEPAPSEAPASP